MLEVDAPFMSSGDTASPAVITLKNAGTVDGATLDFVFSYAESDGSPNGNKTDDEVAAMLEVVALDYGDSGLGLDSIAHTNDNGYKDVQDLAGSAFTGLTVIAAPDTGLFEISVRLRGETPNDFQSDGITITMTFTLNQ